MEIILKLFWISNIRSGNICSK